MKTLWTRLGLFPILSTTTALLTSAGCDCWVGGDFDGAVVEAYSGKSITPKFILLFYHRHHNLPGEPVGVLRPDTNTFRASFPSRLSDPFPRPHIRGIHDPFNHYALFCFAEGYWPAFIKDGRAPSTGTLPPNEDVNLVLPTFLGSRGKVRFVLFSKDGPYTIRKASSTATLTMPSYLPLIKGCLDIAGSDISVGDRRWIYDQMAEAASRAREADLPAQFEESMRLINQYREELLREEKVSGQEKVSERQAGE